MFQYPHFCIILGIAAPALQGILSAKLVDTVCFCLTQTFLARPRLQPILAMEHLHVVCRFGSSLLICETGGWLRRKTASSD
jgi:hypothetical protein